MKAIKRLMIAVALGAGVLSVTLANAQSDDAGPLPTPAGPLQFTRDISERGAFVAMLDQQTFDRFEAASLTHFDDPAARTDSILRMLVQTDAGPVLYDFRRRPARIERIGRRLSVRRVFWQADEIVMQGAQGWFRFQRGTLTKLQSSTTIYH